MRTDTLVHEAHHIPSEKGEMEAMPGRSCDETAVVNPPSFHKLALLAPCRPTAPISQIWLVYPADCHERDYTIGLLHTNKGKP